MEEKAWKRILTKKKRKIIISIFDILSHGFWEQEVAIKNAWLWENVLLESFEISTRWKWSEKSAPRKFREKKLETKLLETSSIFAIFPNNQVTFCNVPTMKGTKSEKWQLTRQHTYQNWKEAQSGQDLTNGIWGKYTLAQICNFEKPEFWNIKLHYPTRKAGTRKNLRARQNFLTTQPQIADKMNAIWQTIFEKIIFEKDATSNFWNLQIFNSNF